MPSCRKARLCQRERPDDWISPREDCPRVFAQTVYAHISIFASIVITLGHFSILLLYYVFMNFYFIHVLHYLKHVPFFFLHSSRKRDCISRLDVHARNITYFTRPYSEDCKWCHQHLEEKNSMQIFCFFVCELLVSLNVREYYLNVDCRTDMVFVYIAMLYSMLYSRVSSMQDCKEMQDMCNDILFAHCITRPPLKRRYTK